MKYFFDTEFIENGETIDLISIGIIAEDGRTLYMQNVDCKFTKASDWVWRNVFPHLIHFDMRGQRDCNPQPVFTSDPTIHICYKPNCCWAAKYKIRDAVKEFCDPDMFGKPEFWGYYSDYDWVAFCQLFGAMIDLPKGYPMYCRDIKQLCDDLGNPHIPKSDVEIHHALVDANWVQMAHAFLMNIKETLK